MAKPMQRQRDLFATSPPPIAMAPPQRADALALLGALLIEALRPQAAVAGARETSHDQDHA